MSFNINPGNLHAIWERYQDFESFARKKDGDLNHFIEDWKEKMAKVQSAGCQYSDLLLGLKLMEKVNLGQEFIEAIVTKLGTASYDSFLTQVVIEIKEQNIIYRTTDEVHKEIKSPKTNMGEEDNFLLKLESKFKEEDFDKDWSKVSFHTCQDCGFQLTSHADHASGEMLQCSSCGTLVINSANSATSLDFFTCTKCPIKFLEAKRLVQHYEEFHPNVKIDLAAILKTGSSKGNASLSKCSFCGKGFMTREALENHMKTHADRGSNACKSERVDSLITKNQFDGDSLLGEDIKEEIILEAGIDPSIVRNGSARTLKHREKQARDALGNLVSGEEHPQSYIPCEICGKSVAWKSIKRHLARHAVMKRKEARRENSLGGNSTGNEEALRKVPCEICGKTVAERRMKVHLSSHNPKDIECNICQKLFNTNRRLKIHMETHKTTLDFICSYCGKKYKTKATMKEHMNLHTKAKVLACQFCDKTFLGYSSLRLHTRIHHTGVKPYKCDFCDLRFFASGHRARHMRTHTGEKPYCCEVCGKQFSDYNHRKRHVKNVHNKMK